MPPKVPIHIVQSYQDEQTGPRGSNLLWQKLDEYSDVHVLGLPLRLILTNGVHSTNTTGGIQRDRNLWFDRFLGGEANGIETKPRVKVWLETHDGGSGLVPNGTIEDPDWPLAQTNWQRWFLGAGSISPTPPGAAAGRDVFAAGVKRAGAWRSRRQAWAARSPPRRRPISCDISARAIRDRVGDQDRWWPRCTYHRPRLTPSLYVELSDVAADGTEMRIQRGMLKASHRDFDPALSDYNACGDLIRPWRVSKGWITNLLTPLEITVSRSRCFPPATCSGPVTGCSCASPARPRPTR